MPSSTSDTVPERAGQPEPAGDAAGQLDGSGGDQPDPLAGVEVQLGERAGPGPDPVGHQLVVDLLAEARRPRRRCARRRTPSAACFASSMCAGSSMPAQPERQLLPGERREVAPGEEVPGGQPAGEVVDRRALHHRVVDVEERGDRADPPASSATGLDLGRRSRRQAGLDRAVAGTHARHGRLPTRRPLVSRAAGTDTNSLGGRTSTRTRKSPGVSDAGALSAECLVRHQALF